MKIVRFSSPILPETVAIVTPWFGQDLKGGAEQQAWQIATRLASRGHSIEVLTTCCHSFFDDWSENHLPTGESFEAGILIRRFPVDTRDNLAFDNLNRELLAKPLNSFLPGVSPVSHQRAAIWQRHNINSQTLQDYLQRYRVAYKAFVFLPYLYGPILQGLPLVAERAWLQPCLHNEAYAYLPVVSEIFYRAHGLLFISSGEKQLASQLYGPMVFAKGGVAGAGVESDDLLVDQRVSLPSRLVSRRFLLYLGRRASEKGTERLVAAFQSFRRLYPASSLELVLAGPGAGSYTDNQINVTDLGLVSDAEKAALLQMCLALCQPSTNESFSRVLFEGWICGKPALVNRNCLATATAVQEAQGGWLAGSEDEWVKQLAYIDSQTISERDKVGTKGLQYAKDMADWDRVIGRYEALLGLIPKPNTLTSLHSSSRYIHQILPNFSYGDAISRQAVQMRNWLRGGGYESEIFALQIDPRVSDQCKKYQCKAISSLDAILYHHSIGSEITAVAADHKGPKVLIYHNITPAEFFYPYWPDFASLLRQGRENLWILGRLFPIAVGDSLYNSEELEVHGFNEPGVLPLAIDPLMWNIAPDEILMRQLQDGKHNILFVGRYAPNKCQHHLVEAFASYLTLGHSARLILVGHGGPNDPYTNYIRRTVDYYGLHDHVIMSGHVTDAQLHAYYRTAHIFWSMSEHEGFCVPLIECMWFDIPILAFRSSAVPETINDTGLMFTEKDSFFNISVLAMKLVMDSNLRSAVVSRQRMRRIDFLPENIKPRFLDLIKLL